MSFRADTDNIVSAADISRNFGEWQSRAMTKPVVITHHGRARLILTSADEFDRREALNQPGPGDGQLARTTAQLRGILAQIQEGFIAFDRDLHVSDINRVGELYIGFAKQDLVDRSIQDIVPATRDAIYWNYFKRVLKTGEILDFRCRSAIYPNATVAIRSFPYEGGVGAVFENITVKEEASLDQRAWKALQNAVKADPAMALIKLNVRGGIISADENFSAITGFPEEQLLTFLLADIVHPHDRLSLAHSINDLMRDRSGKIVVAKFMTRNGDDRLLKLTMSAAFEDPATDGLVVCVSDLTNIPQSKGVGASH